MDFELFSDCVLAAIAGILVGLAGSLLFLELLRTI